MSGLSGWTTSKFFDLSSKVLGVCGVSNSLKARRDGGELGGVLLIGSRCNTRLGDEGESKKLGLESLEVGVRSSEPQSGVDSKDASNIFMFSPVSSLIVVKELLLFGGGENNV